MGTLFGKKAQLALLALGLTLAACGGDEETGPSGGPSLGGDGGVVGNADAGTNNPGCFNGTPQDNQQLLNKCAEGCQPFDNSKRLPASYKPGQLPALP